MLIKPSDKERKELAEEEFKIEPVIKLYKNKISYYFCSFRIKELVKSAKGIGEPVVDIGCQQCFVTNMIKEAGKPTFGFDLSYKALSNKVSELPVVQADAYSLPIKSDSCNVICSDMLEHVNNPKEAISELIRVAKKDIVITIPFQAIGNLMRFFALFVNLKLYKNRYHHPLSIDDVKEELKKYDVSYEIKCYPSKFFLMGYLIKVSKI